ncbi:unnamed protein product [Diatraea saccharalis]|uniref:Uncharacterized protein n=1 Tax=Diatraea saccharalis TaxID=40085 RepID=A0A9N9R6N4_9NEOP|nr:unnamed protein product [Diatraea saccharalis]
MDLETDLKELSEELKCDCEIISVIRLRRLKIDGTWIDSETVRVCFKGPTLPPYVYGYGTRFKVEPYTFPVTQCSGCWRYGYILKYCPIKKKLCPKCGAEHDNCETTNFKCLNCKGTHMSLDKSCPVFLKEKEIRCIMCNDNCSYRNALMKYNNVKNPRKILITQEDKSIKETTAQSSPILTYKQALQKTQIRQVTEDTSETENYNVEDNSRDINTQIHKKKTNKNKNKYYLEQEMELETDVNHETTQNSQEQENLRKKNRSVLLLLLLQKCKEILATEENFEEKIKAYISNIIERINIMCS